MQCAQPKLYSLAAPLAFLPVMGFSFSEIGDFFRGMEFRTLFSELVVQLISGVADAIIYLLTGASLGVLGG